ncbi:TPA: hypothetical protein N0F65_002188 [Lagenidium giganteum]|uniref:Uncharacterized protein n=1 Tax=Lagenidium giganteum TaxID=4803 RepID=A0AAV2YM23_9STRA|nr:TPA: hypothetical protein N0F65_002188 [Lagenidium giganteum]
MDSLDQKQAAMEAKYKKRDDASARLAEKMLQGWTLLGVNCPSDECFTPMVRSKEGKLFCVNCNRYAITEEEAKQQQQQQEEQQQLEAAKAAQAQIEQQQRQRDQAAQQQRAPPAPVPVPVAPTPSLPTAGKRKCDEVPLESSDDDFEKFARRKALDALYQKIDVLTQSISTTDHSERLLTITKSIRELAEAIKALS